jgi:uncharacterized protein YybS (DUF2232 family)
MSRLFVLRHCILALASTLFFFVTGLTIPLAGVLFLPLVAQPPLALGLKCGRAIAAGVLAVAVVVLGIFTGPLAALGYGFMAVMVGLLLFSLGRSWPLEAVVAGVAGGAVAAAGVLMLWLFGPPRRLIEHLHAALRENLEVSLRVYERMGFSAERLEFFKEVSSQIIPLALQALPALFFALAVLVILVNLFFIYRRFPHLRPTLWRAGDLKEWKAPEWLVWGFILSGFALFFPGGWGLRAVALNGFLVTLLFYFFQGLAVVVFYFERQRVPLFLRGLGYVLIALEQVLTLVVVVLGLFDLWGDFRRLKNKQLTPSGA